MDQVCLQYLSFLLSNVMSVGPVIFEGNPPPPAVSLLPSLLCHLSPVVIAQLPLTLAPVHDQFSHLLMVFSMNLCGPGINAGRMTPQTLI